MRRARHFRPGDQLLALVASLALLGANLGGMLHLASAPHHVCELHRDMEHADAPAVDLLATGFGPTDAGAVLDPGAPLDGAHRHHQCTLQGALATPVLRHGAPAPRPLAHFATTVPSSGRTLSLREQLYLLAPKVSPPAHA